MHMLSIQQVDEDFNANGLADRLSMSRPNPEAVGRFLKRRSGALRKLSTAARRF